MSKYMVAFRVKNDNAVHIANITTSMPHTLITKEMMKERIRKDYSLDVEQIVTITKA